MHRQASDLTPAVFSRYQTTRDYARAELEQLIRPTGVFHRKADTLIKLGQALVERFDRRGHTIDELLTPASIGRKTANMVLGNAFGIPGITVETHFADEKDPVQVEKPSANRSNARSGRISAAG